MQSTQQAGSTVVVSSSFRGFTHTTSRALMGDPSPPSPAPHGASRQFTSLVLAMPASKNTGGRGDDDDDDGAVLDAAEDSDAVGASSVAAVWGLT